MFELFFLRNCANIKTYLYIYRLFYHRKDVRISFKIIFKSIFLRLLFFFSRNWMFNCCLRCYFRRDIILWERKTSESRVFFRQARSERRALISTQSLEGGNVIILSREKRSATTRQTRILMGGGDAWKDYGYPVYRGKGRRLDHNYQRIDEVKGWRYEWRRWIVIEMFPLWLIICLSVAG